MNKHRRFSAEEKYIIIEEAHHQPGGNISGVCRRHGISSSMFYRWEAQMRAGAKEGLADRSGHKEKAAEAENERLRAELAKKNTVIAELTEALIQEKKGSRTTCVQADLACGEGGRCELCTLGQRA